MKTRTTIVAPILIASMIILTPVSVFAQTTTGTSTKGSLRDAAKEKRDQAQMDRIRERANKEIDRRITALGDVATRTQAFKRVSDEIKSSITNIIQTQITELTGLKSKIKDDVDIETLRTDVQSITKSYRIYMLVIPQVHIVAAADRIAFVTSTLTGVATKLQTRITSAQNDGNDVTKMQTALSDMNTKIADANTLAKAAFDMIGALKPDEGDNAKMQENKKTLQEAQQKIKTAHQDIMSAQKDARDIMKLLKAIKPKEHSASSTEVVSTSTTVTVPSVP